MGFYWGLSVVPPVMIWKAITVLSAFCDKVRAEIRERLCFDIYNNWTLLKGKAEGRSGKRKKYMHGRQSSKQLNSSTFRRAFGMFLELEGTCPCPFCSTFDFSVCRWCLLIFS